MFPLENRNVSQGVQKAEHFEARDVFEGVHVSTPTTASS